MLKTQSRTARKTQPIRRHIQHLNFVNGVHFFTCKSMTRGLLPTVHTQEIDVDTGEARCSCEDFRFNRAKHEPTLATRDNLCKHLKRCARWLEDHNEMPDLSMLGAHRCIHCGMPDAAHEVCDERGHKADGHICNSCVQAIRLDQMVGDEELCLS